MRTLASNSGAARRGVTLIECAGASIILGIMITAGLRAAAGAGASQATSARALNGSLLAESLMNEILERAYSEPDGASGMGIDSGETASDKSTFDDVDDFHNWAESPPRSPDGSIAPNMAQWARSAKVFRAVVASPETSTGTETGLKRIEVTVSYAGKIVCALTGLKAAQP